MINARVSVKITGTTGNLRIIGSVEMANGRTVAMDKREICGTCKYHHHENVDDGWVCVNDESDYCTDFTEYDDTCNEWEGR